MVLGMPKSKQFLTFLIETLVDSFLVLFGRKSSSASIGLERLLLRVDGIIAMVPTTTTNKMKDVMCGSEGAPKLIFYSVEICTTFLARLHQNYWKRSLRACL
jgi:hypothetical protein